MYLRTKMHVTVTVGGLVAKMNYSCYVRRMCCSFDWSKVFLHGIRQNRIPHPHNCHVLTIAVP